MRAGGHVCLFASMLGRLGRKVQEKKEEQQKQRLLMNNHGGQSDTY